MLLVTALACHAEDWGFDSPGSRTMNSGQKSPNVIMSACSYDGLHGVRINRNVVSDNKLVERILSDFFKLMFGTGLV